ncbi:MAG: putative sulfate transporter [Firmicutes bacterium ADurb.Bin193]|nr:MAG: putative sulfate transporter [Firmicutes bacterium ADurb.Bin193]
MSKISSYFPIIETVRTYKKSYIKYDITAALSTLVVSIPQCMACALIIGIPPVYGLYTAVIAIIASSLFSSSQYLITGPTNAIGLLIVGSIAKFLPEGTEFLSERFYMMLFFLTLMVGLIQFLMGVLNFGKILDYVSHSVMVGFMTGAGILIAIGQLPPFFGLKIEDFSEMIAFEKVWEVIRHLPRTNIYALVISGGTVLFILAMKRFFPKLPAPFLAIIIMGVGVVVFGLEGRVALTQKFESALPAFTLLDFSLFLNRNLWAASIPVAIVGLVEAVSISKALSLKTGEKVDFNQEFRAQGISNIAASFFKGIVSSGSFSKTATNYIGGARTRVSALLTGVFLAITLFFFSSYAQYIPTPALAGVMMVIAYNLIEYDEIKRQAKIGGADSIVIFATLISTLIFELDIAVYIGVIISIVIYLKNTNSATTKILVPSINNKGRFKERDMDWIDSHSTKILVVQFEGNLYFGQANDISKKLEKISDRACGFVLRLKGVTDIDSTVLEVLKSYLETAHANKKMVVLSGLNTEIYDKMKAGGIIDIIGEENIVMAKDYVLEASNIAVDMIVEKLNIDKSCEKISCSDTAD